MTDKRRSILLVDDEAIILLALKRELRNAFGPRYRYETAMSGKAAFDLIEKLRVEGEEPFIVVSDWLMPGMSGDDLLRRVHAAHPGMRLVLLSGQADDAAVARLFAAIPGLAYLRKPWRIAELLALIREADSGTSGAAPIGPC